MILRFPADQNRDYVFVVIAVIERYAVKRFVADLDLRGSIRFENLDRTQPTVVPAAETRKELRPSYFELFRG